MERLAAAAFASPSGCPACVVAGRREAHALDVAPRSTTSANGTAALGRLRRRAPCRPAKTTRVLGHRARRARSEQLAATGASRSRSVSHAALHRRAVEVRAARRRGRRGVRHLVRAACVIIRIASAGRPSSRIATPSIFVCRPWPISVPPWFTCTRAVAVDDAPARRPGCSDVSGERDAELHRRDREPALDARAALRSTASISARRSRELRARPRATCQIVCDAVVADLLAVVRRVGLAAAVIEVSLAHDLRRQAERAARCGPGSPRSPACPAARRSRGTRCSTTTFVFATRPGEVARSGRSRRCRGGTARGRASAARDRATSRRPRRARPARAQELPVAVEADVELRVERMPLAGELHVDDRDRAARAPAGRSSTRRARRAPPRCCPASPCRRSRRPCAAPARRPCCAAGAAPRATIGLDLRRMLRRRADEHVAVVAALRPRRVRLEVEMLLAADLELAVRRVRRSRRARRRSRRAGCSAARCGSCPRRSPLRCVRIARAAARTRPRPARPRAAGRATRRRRPPRSGRGTSTSSSASRVSSWRTAPTLLCPGMSSAISTATTPGHRSAPRSRRGGGSARARAARSTGQISSIGRRCAVSST